MRRRPLACLIPLLPLLVGCVHHDRPTIRVDGCEWRPVDEFPDDSKGLVYVFLIDAGESELGPVREHLNQIGFRKTFLGRPAQAGDLMVEMGVAHAEQPTARFAIIGYGSGVEAARRLAAFAGQMRIPLDLTVYLEPPAGEGPPDPALSCFTIRAAEVQCPGGPAGLPTHRPTLELIERELTLLTMAIVPPRRPEPKRVHLVTPIPPPRETIPRPKPLPLDWQFLRLRHPADWPLPRQRPDVETLPMPRVVPDLPPPMPAS
jgi:hypothetical protein